MTLKEFEEQWVGRTYRCEDTGVVVTLTLDQCKPRAFIGVGKGAIDLGNGFYSRRVGNVVEVKDSDE